MKKAIIIGASSGIGRELAKLLSNDKVFLGITGRRTELLLELKQQLPHQSKVEYMDICEYESAVMKLDKLITEMGGVDLIIICSGIGFFNNDLDIKLEQDTIDTNIKGVTAMICASMKYFLSQGHGHLAVISSIAAIRGCSQSPAYNASKAYISNYIEGMQCIARKSGKNIYVTDIKPGLVDIAMAKGDGLVWVAPVSKAGRQIYSGILKKKKCIYVTKRWKLIAILLKITPSRIYQKHF